MTRPTMHHTSIATLLIALLVVAAAAAEPIDPSPVDCLGPAPEAEPGTPEWEARDAQNALCSEQRRLDQALDPATALPDSAPTNDAYREPSRHDGIRFRFTAASVGSIEAELYRPCAAGACPALPSELATFEPPYPAVIILHGGSSRKEYHWWSSQTLAEAGYMVLAIDSTGNADAALNWLLGEQTNPFAAELDRDRVGIAGHSTGGGNAILRQGDPRVSAIVAWDGGADATLHPDGRTPTLFLRSDGGGGLAYPTPRDLQLSPVAGYVNQRAMWNELRDRGVDAMLVVGRATNHTDFVGGEIWGSRYAEQLWVYFDLAWFDRYLKGKLVLSGAESPAQAQQERTWRAAIARDAFVRLTATVFDDSAQRHNISQGFWDPELALASGDPIYGGNVPYHLVGLPIADRLSFYYQSLCYVAAPESGGSPAARADTTPEGDMRREGCTPLPEPAGATALLAGASVVAALARRRGVV